MGKFAVKLFRDLEKAGKALHELESRGYGPEEIGVLLRTTGDASALVGETDAKVEIKLPEVGPAIVTGPLARAVKDANGDGNHAAALAKALALSPELYSFYEFGLSLGGVLLSVQADDERLEEARLILRSVEATTGDRAKGSPGFTQASRMTRTDPLDAKMSGDFRKY